MISLMKKLAGLGEPRAAAEAPAKKKALFKDLQLSRGAEDGAVLELLDPVSREPTGWKIRLRGADAPTLQAVKLEQRRRRLEQLAKQGHDRVDPAEFDEDLLELLVAATIEWCDVELEPGVPFECTPLTARAAYGEKWIREQAAEFVSRRANFLPRSASA